jgi:subtilisin family serine protease
MKRIFTLFKTMFVFILLVSFVFNSYAQDWTKKTSNLYYIGSEGKVFIEPDYSSYAVYFKDNEISERSELRMKENLSREKSSSDLEVYVMNRKGMILVKSASTNLLKNREEVLKTHGLQDDGAYDVLPAFKDRGEQVFLTKRVSISLKDGFIYDDFVEIFKKYGAEYQRKSLDGSFDVLNVEMIENQLLLIQELNEMGVLNWGGPDFKSNIKKYADPLYQYQWHLNNTGGTSYNGSSLVSDIDIDAPEAWAITTGSSSITIGIIDDGIDNSHEDMPTPLTGYTPANNGNGTPSATDDGHGQLVAGLIMSQHDNNLGGKGVAPNVNYFSVNIFAPNTTNSDVADGITWAVNQGADILSNSWGWGSCTYTDASVSSAFASAASNGRNGKGCLIFVASGNDFFSCVGFPANLSTVWAVGGMSGDADRSNFSNYGPALDICAPSDDNWVNGSPSGDYGCPSTDRMGSLGWTSDNYYMYMGGTSGATPIVSGVAALVLSVDPTLTKSQAETILANTANSSFSAYNSNEFGAGMVNAYDAIVAAGGSGGNDTDPPTTPTGLNSSNVGSSSFDLSWNASTDDTGVTGYNIYLNGSNIGSSATTSTSVTGLNPSTTYAVRVSAYDAAGNESTLSTAINVTTGTSTISCSSTISSFPYSEGFESGIGTWTQDSGDDLDWTVDANGTPSSRTGPSSADEGTYYIYVESSSPNYPSKVGIINSPCIDLTNETSATYNFAYHMYGANMGTIELQASTDGANWNAIWTKSGDQGNSWYNQAINLSSYLGAIVQFRYVATTGSSYRSDFAIDDINITNGVTPTVNNLTLTITFDNYPEETSWTLKNSGGSTVASGGTYASQADGSTLVIPITGLANGCYDFTINDSYGDGICCSYGSGSYTLEVTGGATIKTGGSFGSSELTNFCIPLTAFNFAPTTTSFGNIETTPSINLYPNPANSYINVEIANALPNGVISIYNSTGALVKVVDIEDSEREVNISELPSGLYIISVETKKEALTKQFIKK